MISPSLISAQVIGNPAVRRCFELFSAALTLYKQISAHKFLRSELFRVVHCSSEYTQLIWSLRPCILVSLALCCGSLPVGDIVLCPVLEPLLVCSLPLSSDLRARRSGPSQAPLSTLAVVPPPWRCLSAGRAIRADRCRRVAARCCGPAAPG